MTLLLAHHKHADQEHDCRNHICDSDKRYEREFHRRPPSNFHNAPTTSITRNVSGKIGVVTAENLDGTIRVMRPEKVDALAYAQLCSTPMGIDLTKDHWSTQPLGAVR